MVRSTIMLLDLSIAVRRTALNSGLRPSKQIQCKGRARETQAARRVADLTSSNLHSIYCVNWVVFPGIIAPKMGPPATFWFPSKTLERPQNGRRPFWLAIGPSTKKRARAHDRTKKGPRTSLRTCAHQKGAARDPSN